jgi:hypothetical protein
MWDFVRKPRKMNIAFHGGRTTSSPIVGTRGRQRSPTREKVSAKQPPAVIADAASRVPTGTGNSHHVLSLEYQVVRAYDAKA